MCVCCVRFAANKACLRDVAGRFGMATATAFRVVERTLEYFLDIAEEVISFPGDLDQLSADFEQVRILGISLFHGKHNK